MKTQALNLKSFVFVFLTVLLIFGMKGTVYGQKLNVGKPRTVRMIYFRPSDRPFRQKVVDAMKTVIRHAQIFYGEQMQTHGWGNKTFRFETDELGEPLIQRVVGQYPSSHYGFSGDEIIPSNEFSQRLDKIDFIVYDLSDVAVHGSRQGKNDGIAEYSAKLILAASKSASRSLYTGEYNFMVVLHEIGHAFGLPHDWRDGAYIMSYGPPGWNQLSACAADFLAVHPYFNPDIPLEEGAPPTIELISQRTYPAGTTSVPVRLKVNDSDGLHQVLLLAHAGLKACQRLNGENDTIVEFDYDGVISPATDPNRIGTTLSNPTVHPIGVGAVDVYGNVSWLEFGLSEISSRLIATFEGPTTGVNSLAFSSNGEKIASASFGGVRIWDVATRHLIATFDGGAFVAFSPDGKKIAHSHGNVFRLSDIATKRDITTFEGHTDFVNSVAFSPDGKKIASGSYDGKVKLWDVATKRDIATFEGHTDSVNSVAFSPDGKKIASGSSFHDGTVKLWDVATRTNTASFDVGEGWPIIHSVAFSPDGATLAAGRGNGIGGVLLWNVKTGHIVTSLGEGSYNAQIFDVHSIAFSPDGEVLVSGSRDGTVKLWDLATSTHIGTLSHTSPVLSVAFSPDGTTLASGTWDGVVSLWDLPPKALVSESLRPPIYWIDTEIGTLHRLVGAGVENLAPKVKNVTGLAVDVAGDKLYWTEKTGNRTGRIRRANLDGTNVQLVKDLTSVPLDIALDTVNRKIYLMNSWGKVQRLNFNGSNFQPNLITGLQTPNHLALDGTRGKIYWTEQTSDRTGKIRRANLDGTNVELVKNLTSVPRGIAADNVNGKIYLANPYGKVQRLNLNGSNFQPNLITGLESPEGIAVDAVSRKLYWTEKGSISRANLNGKNIENIVTGLNSPANIALSITSTNAAIASAPAMLQGLPDETRLYPNYPNPFNPETWIPYQLSEPAAVTLHIYATDGRLIRTLALGHQPAGMYQSKSRAVYWDGRNNLGEPVASGVYFYTLTVDDFTATRKMLILK